MIDWERLYGGKADESATDAKGRVDELLSRDRGREPVSQSELQSRQFRWTMRRDALTV